VLAPIAHGSSPFASRPELAALYKDWPGDHGNHPPEERLEDMGRFLLLARLPSL
jgi:hypothetical protein